MKDIIAPIKTSLQIGGEFLGQFWNQVTRDTLSFPRRRYRYKVTRATVRKRVARFLPWP